MSYGIFDTMGDIVSLTFVCALIDSLVIHVLTLTLETTEI